MNLEEAINEALDILLKSTEQDDVTTVVVPVKVLHALVTEYINLNDVAEAKQWHKEYEQYIAESYTCKILNAPCRNCNKYGCEHREWNGTR